MSDLTILWRTLPDLWPANRPGLRVRVVISVLLLVLAKGTTLLVPFIYREAIDSLTPGETALIAAPVLIVVAYGVARFMGAVLRQLRDQVFAEVGQHALRRLGLRVFRHVHRLSLAYHIGRRTGALSRIVDRGIKAIDFLLRHILFSIVPLGLELIIVAVIFLVEFGALYAAILVVTFIAYTVFTFLVSEWRVTIRKEMNDHDQNAFQKAVDSLLNYETVKYFSAEAREAARYDQAMSHYQRAAVRTQSSLALLNSGQALILGAATVAVMAMAARAVMAGEISVGSFVMINAFMIQIMVPLNFLGSVYREIRQALVDMREMYALMLQEPGVCDRGDAPALLVGRGEVRFENVSFRYHPDRPVLEDVSFTIPPGGSLAIVGASGAGKSTIARLLFRFYDVSGGAILIDGQDIRDVTQESLRQAIGVVPQDTVLFNDSIGYNIAYGRADAGQAEVMAAAKAAQIDGFIETLPDGYDALVGERGLKLSGGEKQRVAIARTMLKNPPVLILDEATSALDLATEAEIQAGLGRLGRGRTVLKIAHRLSTVVDADEIIVLDGGRIVERGSHATLLGARGHYASLWNRQAAGEAA